MRSLEERNTLICAHPRVVGPLMTWLIRLVCGAEKHYRSVLVKWYCFAGFAVGTDEVHRASKVLLAFGSDLLFRIHHLEYFFNFCAIRLFVEPVANLQPVYCGNVISIHGLSK